eukprot:CAMPEP_0168627690 /NCGR_PEP_ID=MMETSP0449_2-20121227/11409_1 /TAXON_ID=1082188 /ORGANISM="Strombidium rassoulzadegani, Strain ras09" /LENGTH=107 /DNA_ID=CAMNT_0008669987 /DNA_START=710 /DNA_END=1033 /DNA_ORIENTATION=-
MFHQSFHWVKDYPFMTIFTKEETVLYADPLLLKLVAILIKCDSGSYTFLFRQERFVSDFKEIKENSLKVIKMVEEYYDDVLQGKVDTTKCERIGLKKVIEDPEMRKA